MPPVLQPRIFYPASCKMSAGGGLCIKEKKAFPAPPGKMAVHKRGKL